MDKKLLAQLREEKKSRFSRDLTLLEPMGPGSIVGAISVFYRMVDTFPLIHGPVGCKFLPEFTMAWYTDELVEIGCTYLNESDVVMSGEKKLADVIRKTYQDRRPRLIAVIATDASAMIGDNVESVLDQLRLDLPELKLLFIDSPGFRGDYIDGVNCGMNALVEHIMTEPDAKRPGSVNVVGEFNAWPDQEEIRRCLKAASIDVNCFITGGASLEDIENAPAASLNALLMTESGLECAKAMEAKYSIPYYYGVAPLGLGATRNWLLGLAREIDAGDGAIKSIEREYEGAKKEIDQVRDELKGLRAAIFLPGDKAVAFSRFLSTDLGMEVVAVGLTNTTEEAFNLLKDVYSECSIEPETLIVPNLYEVEELLATVPLDIVMATEAERSIAYENKLPTVSVSYPVMMGILYFNLNMYKGGAGKKEAMFGFRGAENLARRILKECKDPTIPITKNDYWWCT